MPRRREERPAGSRVAAILLNSAILCGLDMLSAWRGATCFSLQKSLRVKMAVIALRYWCLPATMALRYRVVDSR